mmetsp:Transcript_34464/g.68166  ORF Transcript_34464/g.68166 Transcript_34464/m.68166 type:complete len:104 (+) Transcript_34464:44-355(+)
MRKQSAKIFMVFFCDSTSRMSEQSQELTEQVQTERVYLASASSSPSLEDFLGSSVSLIDHLLNSPSILFQAHQSINQLAIKLIQGPPCPPEANPQTPRWAGTA